VRRLAAALQLRHIIIACAHRYWSGHARIPLLGICLGDEQRDAARDCHRPEL